tara:strand:+ start:489 stop:668 length:180 start_codon:yes stop_codon:yes gene_type:complete
MKVQGIINWHRSFVENVQKQFGISNYALYWFGFFEGALVLWVITKLLSFFSTSSTELPF